jgi:hypothetical protein
VKERKRLAFIGLTSDMIMIENDGRTNITDFLKKYLWWPMLVGNTKFKEATKDYVEHRIHEEIERVEGLLSEGSEGSEGSKLSDGHEEFSEEIEPTGIVNLSET